MIKSRISPFCLVMNNESFKVNGEMREQWYLLGGSLLNEFLDDSTAVRVVRKFSDLLGPIQPKSSEKQYIRNNCIENELLFRDGQDLQHFLDDMVSILVLDELHHRLP